MKLCLSGSMTAIEQMKKLSELLKAIGHETSIPSRGTEPHMVERLAQAETHEKKAIFVQDHLEKIRECEGVVIANFEKNGVFGYVGPSALMEAAMAYALGKQVFVLNDPSDGAVDSDLSSLGAIKLSGDYRLITSIVR